MAEKKDIDIVEKDIDIMEKGKDVDVIEKLLQLGDEKITRTIYLKRLDLVLTIRPITTKEMFELRRRCTYRNPRTKDETYDIEKEQLGIIVIGTVSPNWKDERLLSKYNVLTGEDVVRRVLLPGEVVAVAYEIQDLSGFNEEVEDVKN